MSVAAVSSSSSLVQTATPAATVASTTAAATTTTATTTTATDTADISAAAQAASDTTTSSNTSTGSSTSVSAAFEAALKQLHDNLNAYEHQSTWLTDNDDALTVPAGTSTSGAGTAVITSATTSTELVNTQATSAVASAVSLQIAGSLGTTTVSFAAGTALSAAAAAVNAVTSATGVTATASGSTLKFDPSAGSVSQFVTVTAVSGSFDTTASNQKVANAQTIADGFATLESTLNTQFAGTSDQLALTEADQSLTTEQGRFENFIHDRTTPSYGNVTHNLSDQINAYEHQVTYQIDNDESVTAPNSLSAANTSTGSTSSTSDTTTSSNTSTTSNASTGTTTNTSTGTTSNTSTGTTANTSTGTTAVTLSQTIATGFASLEAAAAAALGPLTTQQATAFATLEQSLSTEQTRFTAFAQRRNAYQVAQQTTASTTDVAA